MNSWRAQGPGPSSPWNIARQGPSPSLNAASHHGLSTSASSSASSSPRSPQTWRNRNESFDYLSDSSSGISNATTTSFNGYWASSSSASVTMTHSAPPPSPPLHLTPSPPSFLLPPPAASAGAQALFSGGILGWEGDVTKLIVEGPPLVSQPKILVTPKVPVNYTDCFIQFCVNLLNFPEDTNFRRVSIEGKVYSPSGSLVSHSFGPPEKSFPFSPFNTYRGSFRSSDQPGVYRVEVEIHFPVSAYSREMTVVSDTAEVLVSRNYMRQARFSQVFIQIKPPGWKSLHNVVWSYDELPNTKGWGLACDRQTNRLYYTDRAANKVFCVDATTGKSILEFNNAGEFQLPTGITVDEYNHRLVVSDKDNHRICMFSMDGEHISSFGQYGHGPCQFFYPWDVAVDPNGSTIAVADSRNRRIQLFDRFGNYVDRYCVLEREVYNYKQEFDTPRGITFNLEGTSLYTTDFNSHNVLEIWRDFSGHRRLFADEPPLPGQPSSPPNRPPPRPHTFLQRPQGIAIDEVSGLLICDSKNDRVHHMAVDGTVSSIKELAGQYVKYPMNVALLGGGKVAVLDGKGRICTF